MQPVVFSADWFAAHQRTLLTLLRLPVIGRWFRWVLCIRPHDVGYRQPIVALYPHAYTVANADGSLTTDVRTHAKYAKRLYYAFRPLWWALHAWDALIANPFVPALNAGFDTLTAYPDPNPEVTTVDGDMRRAPIPTEDWATIRSGAGTAADDTTDVPLVAVIDWDAGNTNKFGLLMRAIFLFDTSALTSKASIESVTMSLWGHSTTGGVTGQAVNIYTSNPASNTALGAADFATLGTTPLASDILLTAWSTTAYNDFALNTTGLGTIAKAGVTKLGTREATYDATGTTSPWGFGYIVAYGSERTGSANDPKLVVTYSIPVECLVTLLGTTP